MMKKYPALKVVSWLYKIVAILAGIGMVLAAALSGNIIMLFFGSLVALLTAITIYAVGEGIILFIRMGQNIEKTSTNAEKTNIALLRIYQAQAQTSPPTRKPRPINRKKGA